MEFDRKLPKAVRAKAQGICDRLQGGTPVRDLRGQRMRHDRSLISIPVGRRYRLLVVESDEGMDVRDLLTHEAYNKKYGTPR